MTVRIKGPYGWSSFKTQEKCPKCKGYLVLSMRNLRGVHYSGKHCGNCGYRLRKQKGFLGEKGEDSSVSHRLLRTCCRQYDKNEENSIYKEFHRHDKWLELASKCKESWQEFQGIPSPLPSCRLTKTACYYDDCPKNVWKETQK